MPKISANSNGVTRSHLTGGAKYRWGRLKSAIFDQYLAVTQKRCKIDKRKTVKARICVTLKISKALRMARVKGIEFYLPLTRLSMNGMSHPWTYLLWKTNKNLQCALSNGAISVDLG